MPKEFLVIRTNDAIQLEECDFLYGLGGVGIVRVESGFTPSGAEVLTRHNSLMSASAEIIANQRSE